MIFSRVSSSCVQATRSRLRTGSISSLICLLHLPFVVMQYCNLNVTIPMRNKYSSRSHEVCVLLAVNPCGLEEPSQTRLAPQLSEKDHNVVMTL